MSTVDEAIASFERNIAAQTGRPVADWARLVRGQGAMKHGQMVTWLKAEHGLSHAHANHIAKHAAQAEGARATDDPVGQIFAGKEAMRPIYDRLAAVIGGFGADVELAPKKANVSVRRRRQFALLQPSTKTRLDVGLILERKAAGRLELSGSFNAMFTHRVKVPAVGDVDKELIGWLKEAYDAAE